MKSTQQILLLALGTVALLLPADAVAQDSGVQLWTKRCGACHVQQPANRYTAGQWESIVTHMTLMARIPDAQADAILAFLKSGAKEGVARAEGPPAEGPSRELMVASAGGMFLPDAADRQELYETNCAPCHGESGKGNGPAAPAFNPRPADLTDQVVQRRPAEDLVSVIMTGKGGMPAFGATLSREEIDDVVAYIRTRF
jgi:cytochrome c5